MLRFAPALLLTVLLTSPGCDDAPEPAFREASDPIDADDGEDEIDAPADLDDVIALYEAEPQRLLVLAGWEDAAIEMFDLTWVADGFAVFGDSDLMVEVVVVTADEQPTLIREWHDEIGGYRLYKNAQCSKLRDAAVASCIGPDEHGRYNTTRWQERHRCKRGKSLCLEEMGLEYEITYHSDAQCQGPRLFGTRESWASMCNPALH